MENVKHTSIANLCSRHSQVERSNFLKIYRIDKLIFTVYDFLTYLYTANFVADH